MQDKGYVGDATGDLQKIDVGIALCHFLMGLEEQGKEPEVVVSNPGIGIPDGVEYIASVIVQGADSNTPGSRGKWNEGMKTNEERVCECAGYRGGDDTHER